MSDIWESVLYTATYADLRLDILLLEDDVSRTLAIHEFVNRDGGLVQDMGEQVRRTRARIIFFERAASLEQEEGLLGLNAGNHIDRFELFMEFARDPDNAEFVHPLTGSYPAKVQELRWNLAATERDAIVVDCTFVEDSINPSALSNDQNLNTFSTRNTVAETVDELKAQLTANSLSSAVPDDALTAVDGWQDPDTSVRKVNQEMARLSSRINDDMETFELTTDITRYETYRQYIRLHNELVKASEAFKSTRTRLLQVTLIVGQPLRTLLSRIYGAAEIDARYQEVNDLNDIRDPSLIPAGTVVRYHAPELNTKKGLRNVAK